MSNGPPPATSAILGMGSGVDRACSSIGEAFKYEKMMFGYPADQKHLFVFFTGARCPGDFLFSYLLKDPRFSRGFGQPANNAFPEGFPRRIGLPFLDLDSLLWRRSPGQHQLCH